MECNMTWFSHGEYPRTSPRSTVNFRLTIEYNIVHMNCTKRSEWIVNVPIDILQPRPKRQYIRRKPLASKKPPAPQPEPPRQPPPDPYAFIDDEDMPSTSAITDPLSLSQGMLDFQTQMSPASSLDLTQSAPSSMFVTEVNTSQSQDDSKDGAGKGKCLTNPLFPPFDLLNLVIHHIKHWNVLEKKRGYSIVLNCSHDISATKNAFRYFGENHHKP